MRRVSILCQYTPVLEVHRYKSELSNRRKGTEGRMNTCDMENAAARYLVQVPQIGEEKVVPVTGANLGTCRAADSSSL